MNVLDKLRELARFSDPQEILAACLTVAKETHAKMWKAKLASMGLEFSGPGKKKLVQ